jgi:hypothetical protein
MLYRTGKFHSDYTSFKDGVSSFDSNVSVQILKGAVTINVTVTVTVTVTVAVTVIVTIY